MAESKLTPEELGNNIDYKVPSKNWMDPKVEFNKGTFNYSGIPKNVEYLQLPNPRKWQPTEDGWQLPVYDLATTLDLNIDYPVPPLNVFLGGHGSMNTRPIMMAFMRPGGMGANVAGEAFISDIATTVASIFDLQLLSSTIGHDLSDEIR